jgi:hypothetical protein
MKPRIVLSIVLLVVCGALGLSARPRFDSAQRFVATTAEMIRPGRPASASVDIMVTSWTSVQNHRLLMRTLLEKGPNAFADLLCNYSSYGSFGVRASPDVTIRYAWQAVDRDKSTRIYLATDAPISLAPRWWVDRVPAAEPLTFVELRLDQDGKGEGKLASVRQLSSDEGRDVIELRDYNQLPVRLMRVERFGPLEH